MPQLFMSATERTVFLALALAQIRANPNLPDNPFDPSAWLTAPAGGKGVGISTPGRPRPTSAVVFLSLRPKSKILP